MRYDTVCLRERQNEFQFRKHNIDTFKNVNNTNADDPNWDWTNLFSIDISMRR